MSPACRREILTVEHYERIIFHGQDGPINLDSHARGDIVGEAGLFYQTRTANVDTVEDSRLLRVNQKDLQILRRRYPRIAARVSHNLNEILDNRLVSATQRLS